MPDLPRMAPAAETGPATSPRQPLLPRPWLAAATLCQREWVRFVRQRNRVIGAVGQPVLFWILFGAGLGPSFRLAGDAAGEVSYRDYFFPGTIALILLFTAIFTTISIIEDRREGFLQGVLVAPVPRWSLVLGKLAGGTLIAVAQAGLFVLLGIVTGMTIPVLALVHLAAFSVATAFALTGLGFVIAWKMDSTQGFHAIMSLFLLPMWLLSGAFFPADSGPLAWIMRANPLTYGVAGLRRILFAGAPEAVPSSLPSLGVCWGVTLSFAAITFALSWRMAGRSAKGDLQ